MKMFEQFEQFRFRVWWKKQNRYLRAPVLIFGKMGASCEIFEEGKLTQCVRAEETDIEWSPGLKDKNRNLIYASDLIKSPNNSHLLVVKQSESGLWECWEYRTGGMRELPLFDLIRNYGVEIIGNVHTEEQK